MVWNIILKELKNKITQEQYNKYIKNLVFDEKNSQSDLKILLANNIFIANWVNRNYADKIALLFENQTAIKPTIKIKLKEPKESKKNKTQYDIKIVQINKKQSIINPSLTFDTFVVGESNKFAFKVSEKVAQNQGTLYNPLFISGDTGLGKTHLLNAIGNYNIGKKNVILVNCEEFLNDFTHNLANKTMDKFRNKYRNCDYLLVDDIQFLIGKSLTQEEFFHTLNVLKENNKQLVFTSDKQIKDLGGIEERLKSRFQNGVTAQIQAPELETKIAIIKKKCEIDLINLNDEIINFIATNINNNIRTIEGILMNINSHASIFNQEITIDFVKNAIKSFKNTNTEKITINDIVNTISKYLNIKPSDIKSKKRTKEILLAKKIVIYLSRKLTRNSMPELANFLEFKDHSSISKAMKKIQEEMQENKELELKIEEIEEKIKESKINN